MRHVVLLALAACSGSSTPGPARTTVAILPETVNRDVDVLFVIEDSPGGVELETALKAGFPQFLVALTNNGLPNLHLGVVTTDLGTSSIADAQPGPTIGSGAGMCAGTGKNGALQTNGTTLVNGTFIDDEANLDGARLTNYTGQLADAFDALASVGGSGCGFEQHLEASRRALANNPANAGFVRPDASLAVVFVGDEDDCSLEHASLIGSDTSTLGPLQSFRCTHFGVTCDDGGTTPDEMATPGGKAGCHDNASSPYMPAVADYKAFLDGLKPDPRSVMVATIVGNPTPVATELRAPPGGGTPIPALQHSCEYTDASNQVIEADPGVRLAELAGMMDRGVVGSICSADLSAPLISVARQINSMTGSQCFVRDIAMPADCVVTDDAGPVTACTQDRQTDCYLFVIDPGQCPFGQNLRLERQGVPHGATVVKCTVP